MANTDFHAMTRAAILESFGYMIRDCGPYHVALIRTDPEAFMYVADDHDEAEEAAYEQLLLEVDPELHSLPSAQEVGK